MNVKGFPWETHPVHVRTITCTSGRGSRSSCVVSKFYREFEVTPVPGATLAYEFFSCELGKGASLGGYTSGKWIENADSGTWWMDRASVQSKRHPFLCAQPQPTEQRWTQPHSPSSWAVIDHKDFPCWNPTCCGMEPHSWVEHGTLGRSTLPCRLPWPQMIGGSSLSARTRPMD